MNSFRLAFCCAGLASCIPVSAAIVFQDDFDAGTSGTAWTSSLSAADASVSYAFDYSSIGVPSAPNSTGGSTVGMRFLVNQSAGVFQGISASPNGQSFSGDFVMEFDAWLNYVGPLGPGGNGTTQLATMGWGTAGTTVQWPSSSSSVMMGVTLDGGSAQDYRIYKNNAQDVAAATYAAGSQNNSATYYTTAFAQQSAPAAQLGLFPGQTGSTDTGEVAFRWNQMRIERAGSLLTWSINGTLITTTDVTGLTLSGSNVFFGMSDTNAGSSSDPNDFLNTAIYDNIRITVVPEPSVAATSLLAVAALGMRRRRR